MGVMAELEFRELTKQYGYSIRVSGRNEDMNEHWDVQLTRLVHGHCGRGLLFRCKVDVKTASSVHKGYIELATVQGRRGWLFGLADVIAYCTDDAFYLYDKRVLYDYAYNALSASGKEAFQRLEADPDYNTNELDGVLYRRCDTKEYLVPFVLTEVPRLDVWKRQRASAHALFRLHKVPQHLYAVQEVDEQLICEIDD